MRWSAAGLFGSVVTLSGAFLVGVVIHRSVVRGEFSLFAPAGVFGILGGVALIYLGRRLENRFDPSDYVPDSEDEDEEDERREFDERLSPVPQDRLEEREADESYDPDEGTVRDRVDEGDGADERQNDPPGADERG